MSSDGKVIYEVRGDYSKLDGDLNKSHEKVKKSSLGVEKLLTTSAKAIGTAFAASLAAGSAAIVAFGKKGVDLASDLEEVQNVVDTTFGKKGAAKIEEFADAAIERFGLSELSAKQMSSTMGAMLKSMGLADKAVLQMSTNLTGLAGDMASFYNLDPTQAFEKLRSGIAGETEPLKQLGINLSVVNLEAYAASQGITKAYKEMSEAEKVTLRYNYILSVTKDAQGDFAKTSDSYANQTRILGEEVNALAAEMGDILLPAMTKGVGALRESTVGNDEFREALKGVFEIVAQLAETAIPLLADKIASLVKIFDDVIIPVGKFVADAIGPLIASFKEFIGVASQIIKDALPVLMSMFQEAAGVVGNLAQAVLPVLIDAAGALIAPLINLGKEVIPVLVRVAENLIPPLMNLGQSIVPAVLRIFESLIPILKEVASYILPLIDLFAELAGPIIDMIADALNPLVDAIMDLVDTVFPVLKDALNILYEAVETIVRGIAEEFSHAFGTVRDVLNEILRFIQNVFTGNWRSAWENVKNIFGSAFSGLKNLIKTPLNSVIDLVNKFISGIGNIQIPDWVPGVGGKGFSIPRIPRLRVGMDFVPSDDFPALLHRGEAVLTASEAAQWRARYSMPGAAATAGGYGGNVTIDYNRLGAAVAQNIAGMAVQMDKEAVGRLVYPVVSNYQARGVESIQRSGFNGRV